MDRMLSLYILSVSLALVVCCTAPQLTYAQESPTPAAQTDNSSRKNAHEHPAKKNRSVAINRKDVRQRKEKASKSIHAPAWVFGDGTKSSEAWSQGTNTSELKKRAVGESPSSDKPVNTTASINSALDRAQAKDAHKGGLGLSVGQDDSNWRKKGQHEIEADENLPMQSRHVLRAYADVDAGDDLSIKVGPELILKDEQRERTTSNKQPESALGLGMQLKLDF